MAQERFNIPVLVTLDDNSEDLRRFEVEAWSMNDAIDIAEQRAQEDERVIEAQAQIR